MSAGPKRTHTHTGHQPTNRPPQTHNRASGHTGAHRHHRPSPCGGTPVQ